MMIILDTNVISELSRTRPSMDVTHWVRVADPSDLRVTAITEAELRYGVEILPLGRRRKTVLARIEHTFQTFFAGRILPFDSSAARFYAEIAATRRAVGRPISYTDCQIAAIAQSVGAAVATRNVRDFEGCGIEVINPWEGA